MAQNIDILYIGGDSHRRDSTATSLEQADGQFRVETAVDAATALEQLTDSVDCIVSRYDLPDRTGIECLEHVREVRPELPFVLYPSEGSEEVASDAISAGVTDYVVREPGTDGHAVLADHVRSAVRRDSRDRSMTEPTHAGRMEKLSKIINNLPGIIYECRNVQDFPMEYVKGDCESLTGYSAEALESQEVLWGDIVHPADWDRQWEAIQDGLRNDKRFEVTYRIRTKDGATKWMWERGWVIESESGERESLEGFITDFRVDKAR